jgi:hypothetical protein
VLEATRPGLPDLRIRSDRGEEIPYADARSLLTSLTKLPVVDVEVVPSKETTALVDRGDKPGLIDNLDIEVAETRFIKPLVLEASSNRATWSEIAKSSIFATGSGPAMTRVRFAPNDRRYFRLRLDDKNGAPIRPTGVTLGRAPDAREHPMMMATDVRPGADDDVALSTYAVGLPNANLPVTEVRIEPSDAAFVRQVRIFERVWFRDEVSRRLLGQGEIARSGDGRESLNVSISEPTSKHIELEIDRPSGVPLHVSSVLVAVQTRTLFFHAPENAKLELFYGSPSAPHPTYDLASALGKGRPTSFPEAKLGPPIDAGAVPTPIAEAPRGGKLDPSPWRARQPIVLPARGPVAYLDVERGDGPLSDLRIVDAAGAQVPYLIESTPRKHEVPLSFRTETGHGTALHLTGIDRLQNANAIAIDVGAPDYFSRDVVVVETTSDRRGPTSERVLGTAHLEKTAKAPRSPFHVSLIAEPASSSEVTVRIADGDNAPLAVDALRATVVNRRFDFLFAAGDQLTLLSDNPEAAPPQYDLAIVAERVLSSPAEAATLGVIIRHAETRKQVPPWFWAFVAGAAAVLAWAVARAVRPEPGGSSKDSRR